MLVCFQAYGLKLSAFNAPFTNAIAACCNERQMEAVNFNAAELRNAAVQRAEEKIANITERMLTLQLRELEADGLIAPQVFADVPPGSNIS